MSKLYLLVGIMLSATLFLIIKFLNNIPESDSDSDADISEDSFEENQGTSWVDFDDPFEEDELVCGDL